MFVGRVQLPRLLTPLLDSILCKLRRVTALGGSGTSGIRAFYCCYSPDRNIDKENRAASMLLRVWFTLLQHSPDALRNGIEQSQLTNVIRRHCLGGWDCTIGRLSGFKSNPLCAAVDCAHCGYWILLLLMLIFSSGLGICPQST